MPESREMPDITVERQWSDARGRSNDSQRSSYGRLLRELLPLFGILLVATLVRVIGLDSIEPNVMPDEADNLQVVYHVLSGTGPGILGLSWDGQPILTQYFQGMCLRLFGMNIIGMRMSAVIPSLLCIIVLYYFARQRLSAKASLAASFLLSTSLWFLCLSRNAWINIYASLYMLLGAYFVSLALRKERHWWVYYVLTGIAAALGLYSYYAGRLVILALFVYLPFALWTHREQRKRILAGYGIISLVAIILFIPQVPTIIGQWQSYSLRAASTFIFSGEGGSSMGLADKVLVLLDQAQRNLRGFLLMDGSVVEGFRYSVPGEPLLDRISALLFLCGAVLSWRYWRETILWWCFAFVAVAGTQLLSTGTPDAARAIGAAPFYFLFIGLLFDRLIVPPGRLRNAFRLTVLMLLPVIGYINVMGYVNWMEAPSTADIRQPAVEYGEFATWQNLQLRAAQAGEVGFTVTEWHKMRQFLDIPQNVVPAQVYGGLLTEGERGIQAAGGTWSEIFDRQNLANKVPVLVWYVIVQLAGLVAFPLAFSLFRHLRDRGYILAKLLGVLFVVYLTWLASSLNILSFNSTTILLSALLVVLVSTVFAFRQRIALLTFLSSNRRLILLNELLFVVFFVTFCLIRFGNPDLWHPSMGGEKPMDFAYLNAIVKSTNFPPFDPWFAGGFINYYYFGQLIVATLVKLTGVIPSVAYNIAIPWLFASTATGAFCVAFNLASGLGIKGQDKLRTVGTRIPIIAGLCAAVFVAVIGNLGEAKLVLTHLQSVNGTSVQIIIPGAGGLISSVSGLGAILFGGQHLDIAQNAWYWDATRVMSNGEINEFPFFSFLYADLHAHLIAMPFAILALGVILNFALSANGRQQTVGLFVGRMRKEWRWYLGSFIVAGLVLGELRANNTWDFPTYGLLLFVGLVIGHGVWRRRVNWIGIAFAVAAQVAVLLISTVLYWPFLSLFQSGYSNIVPWDGPRTALGDFLTIQGFFLFLIVTFLGVMVMAFSSQTAGTSLPSVRRLLGGWSWGADRKASRWIVTLILAVLVCMVILVSIQMELIAFLLPFIVIVAVMLLRGEASSAERFVLLLIEAGLCLMAALEVVVVDGDIGRMNTVFKFYLQVWVWWGIATAVGLPVIVASLPRWRSGWRKAWLVVFAVLLLSVLYYPLMATSAKVHDRFTEGAEPGLDGMAYMQEAVHTEMNERIDLKDDYEAINWLLDNVKGSPVVLEAADSQLYRWTSRVSVYTGLPTVIGWNWHEEQQRSMMPKDEIERRTSDVRSLYTDIDWSRARELLDKYHISYIYVGELEQIYYPGKGLDKFEAAKGTLLDLVYEKGSVKIYHVRGS